MASHIKDIERRNRQGVERRRALAAAPKAQEDEERARLAAAAPSAPPQAKKAHV